MYKLEEIKKNHIHVLLVETNSGNNVKIFDNDGWTLQGIKEIRTLDEDGEAYL